MYLTYSDYSKFVQILSDEFHFVMFNYAYDCMPDAPYMTSFGFGYI